MIYFITGLIVAGFISFLLFHRQRLKPALNTTKKSNDTGSRFPPRPKWKPNLPIDIDLIYQKAKYYTNGKLQFAVFQNGTVTFFSNRVDNVADSAKNSLDKIYNFHPDFSEMVMDDGNYIIEYSQPAFTIVFKEEIAKNWDYIEKNHQDGLCDKEVLINEAGQQNVFDNIGKICLFGRAKMFMDAQSPKVVKTFNPPLQ
ncbi:MAG: hypothetical protein ABIR15_15895 [Chitinophagaceae bacterium]